MNVGLENGNGCEDLVFELTMPFILWTMCVCLFVARQETDYWKVSEMEVLRAMSEMGGMMGFFLCPSEAFVKTTLHKTVSEV